MSSKLTAYATVPCLAIGNCPGNQGTALKWPALKGVLGRSVSVSVLVVALALLAFGWRGYSRLTWRFGLVLGSFYLSPLAILIWWSWAIQFVYTKF